MTCLAEDVVLSGTDRVLNESDEIIALIASVSYADVAVRGLVAASTPDERAAWRRALLSAADDIRRAADAVSAATT